jgi:hypothetical protein
MLKTLEDNREILKFNAEGVDPGVIWTEACVAGKTAVEEYHRQYGEPMYCGFGHVSIRPARGKFVNFLKKVGVGDLCYNGGYRVSYYDIMDHHPLSHTQSLDLKEACVDAFAKVLQKYGLDAWGVGRAD